jgi:cytochrome c oxidase cbb3-type subunit 1
MIQAKSSATGEVDTSARYQISLLIVSALVWLLVNGVLSLVTTIQLFTPSFLADCSLLTYGRAQAVQESIFIYGWAANAAFAVGFWILGRLGGSAPRGLGLMTVGTIFWNVGVLAGVVCIMAGEGTSVRFLQMPAYIHPLLLVAYAAIATPAFLAWTDRKAEQTYASQWYVVAALFLFPWFYSSAQVMLLIAPVYGVAGAIVDAWFGQNLISLWLMPVGLASAYYLIPKITGRVTAHYDFAVHGFWTLIFFGALTGVRHLVGAPVPAWIPTLGIVSASLVLFHYLIVALNFPSGFSGKGNPILGFVAFGLLTYMATGVIDAIFSFQSLAAIVQYTFFPLAQLKLVLGGSFSFLIFAAIYQLGPRITGREWPSTGMIRTHYLLAVVGTLVSVIGFAVAGWKQGQGLLDTQMTFAAIAASTKTWLVLATLGEAILLLGTVVITVNFVRLTAASFGVGTAPVASTATMEASAS